MSSNDAPGAHDGRADIAADARAHQPYDPDVDLGTDTGASLAATNTGEIEASSLTRWGLRWRQLPLSLALVVLWVFLWDAITVLTIVTGVLLAIVVMRLLYLPPVLFSGRLNLWRAMLLTAHMIYDISSASIQVAFASINPWWRPESSILAVQLHTRSDVVTTLTAEAITVVPGTVVVDIDRERGILYLHAIGTFDEADVASIRRSVLGTEERIVLAIGTREQADEIRVERRARRAARHADRRSSSHRTAHEAENGDRS